MSIFRYSNCSVLPEIPDQVVLLASYLAQRKRTFNSLIPSCCQAVPGYKTTFPNAIRVAKSVKNWWYEGIHAVLLRNLKWCTRTYFEKQNSR